MSYGAYIDAPPRPAGTWTPGNLNEIDINDERELNYWTNELRISIGDLIWLVQKYGPSTERIRAMVR
ncbi:MAG TPA: DUF3606 domain-containing protein [Burkholderiales bacterium]|nr:DUF3606 domain-containing protein [Burkholderiales bacterium]